MRLETHKCPLRADPRESDGLLFPALSVAVWGGALRILAVDAGGAAVARRLRVPLSEAGGADEMREGDVEVLVVHLIASEGVRQYAPAQESVGV